MAPNSSKPVKKGSVPCSKSELDLFTLPPTQVVIDGILDQQFRPVTSLSSGGPIRLEIAASIDQYYDLGSFYLYVRGKIKKHLPSTAAATDTKIAAAGNETLLEKYVDTSNVDLKYTDAGGEKTTKIAITRSR